jgi:hypothetical protein
VRTRLSAADRLDTLRVRLGIGRDRYLVAPGLYCCGAAGPDSPVLITANYKLSFDTLRRELDGLACWILVLDTRGINVWCAAGKGTFSSAELGRRIRASRLAKVVSHRRVIVPQLGATGVAAREVRRGCGFRVVWGPVRAADLRPFLNAGMRTGPAMRRVTFRMAERTVLIPVEVSQLGRPLLWALLGLFLLSGLGPGLFSPAAAWLRGSMAATALFAGVLAGTAAVPVLLPWIPGRAFAVKGAWAGLAAGLAIVFAYRGVVSELEALGMLALASTVSSYLAMNFTGATPFTSPTGVEKEMRRAIPLQAVTVLFASVCWVTAAFAG